jgi:hypothetical protein
MQKLLFFIAFLIAQGAAFAQSKPLPLEHFLWSGQATSFYGQSHDPHLQRLLGMVRNSQLAERMAGVAQTHLQLRYNLGVGFKECGASQAFYDPSNRSITICAEFLGQVLDLMTQKKEFFATLNAQRLDGWINGILWFVFLHELAHAVIDINHVAITGREEDVADQFAAWYALNFVDLKLQPIFGPTAWFFQELPTSSELQKLPPETLKHLMADVHPLQQQRVFNLACWRYGLDQIKGAQLARQVQLPVARLEQCPQEYSRLDEGIKSQFKKYLRR